MSGGSGDFGRRRIALVLVRCPLQGHDRPLHQRREGGELLEVDLLSEVGEPGTYSIRQPKLSSELLARKTENRPRGTARGQPTLRRLSFSALILGSQRNVIDLLQRQGGHRLGCHDWIFNKKTRLIDAVLSSSVPIAQLWIHVKAHVGTLDGLNQHLNVDGPARCSRRPVHRTRRRPASGR